MGQELSDPGRIPFVRLFAWAAAQLVRIANVHLDRPNEHMIDRLPIDPGAFHGDYGAVLLHEPVRQGQERRVGRGKLASLLADLTVGVHATQTRRERVLVDIDATTDGIFYLHYCALLRFLRPTHAETTALRQRVRYSYA
jgi:hypothetical protein